MNERYEFEGLMASEGYTPAFVEDIGHNIDLQVASEATCDECGHRGMEYHPWLKSRPGKRTSYRAWARCPECGAAFEF